MSVICVAYCILFELQSFISFVYEILQITSIIRRWLGFNYHSKYVGGNSDQQFSSYGTLAMPLPKSQVGYNGRSTVRGLDYLADNIMC